MPSRNSICSCGSGRKFKHCHGKHGSSLTIPFDVRFDQLSLSSCHLELFANQTPIGTATGFFWRAATEIYLVTNWHVVTNKDIFTGEQLDGVTCPDLIRAHASFRLAPNRPATVSNHDWVTFEQRPINLVVYHDFDSPCWIQHKDHGKKRIDVVLVRLPTSINTTTRDSIVCLNDYHFEPLIHFVGSPLFIIGYPMNEGGESARFPIWKNGTIASEPITGWKERPAFLIDGRTSKGMSGSPVIRRTFGPVLDSSMTNQLGAAVTSEFLGILQWSNSSTVKSCRALGSSGGVL